MAEDDRQRGLADAAGRAALYPARAAARAWRGRLEEAADDVLSAPEIARIVDRAFAGELPEEVARSMVRHRVLERIVAELAATGELERLTTEALRSPQTLELTDQVLASAEMQRALRSVAASPELRHAIAKQTAGLAEEVMHGARGAAARFDERLHKGGHAATGGFAGVGTRALGLGVDVGLSVVLLMSLTGLVALVSSLVGGLPAWVAGAMLGSGWIVLAGAYFVIFWSSAGQTPGMRLFRVRVRGPGARAPSVARSAVRYVGLLLAIAPFFLGFVPALFDARRRGLHDLLANTVVVHDDPAR